MIDALYVLRGDEQHNSFAGKNKSGFMFRFQTDLVQFILYRLIHNNNNIIHLKQSGIK